MSMCKERPRVLRAKNLLSIAFLGSVLFNVLPVPAQQTKPESPGEPPKVSNQRDESDLLSVIEKLREEVRQLKTDLTESRSRMSAIEKDLILAPAFESEDYAQARAKFRTKLWRKGPAPEVWSGVSPPNGVSEIEYRSGDLRLKAWMNRPMGESRKHPAVLYLHGGYALSADDWNQTQPYRDAGFVVLVPMLRGENGQAGAWSYFYDEVDDVLAAAEYLRREPYVDANRLFVAGHSNGGTLALLVAMASRLFRAATSFDGAPYRPEIVTRQKFLPFDVSNPREAQLRSPIAFAASFKCPVRMYYATTMTFRLATLRTAGFAKRRGIDAEAVEIEGNHLTHVPRAIMRSIAFFQRVSSQEIAPVNNQPAPLPKAFELDLGNNVKLKFARIEPGSFQMGSPSTETGRNDDESLHKVRIANPFAMGIYEVTQAQYRHVMGANPSTFSSKGDFRERVSGVPTDDFPADTMTWEDAIDFCRIVNLLPSVRDRGWTIDLPTEAEWEYAARGGTSTAFYSGNLLSSDQANFNGNDSSDGAPTGRFLARPTSVGSYKPNAWGLYDMHGNVSEWCKDWYDREYQNTDTRDNAGRVVRGGDWSTPAIDCRSAHRRGDDRSDIDTGFRVVVRLRENQKSTTR